jgi:murein DD-endopeptidase MepM/ murein hydrolase activator NlpD
MGFLAVAIVGLLIPERAVIPVEGASASDWNSKSFWYEPWGASGVHKGIDIFASHGRKVVSATPGIVIFRGELGRGGNVVAVLGPKWRIHYYAHLASFANEPRLVSAGSQVGTVGTSGNAAGKPPHLHYTVLSLVPLPWRYTTGTQGWRKMFFLDPGAVLKNDL